MFMNHPDTTEPSPDFTPRACDLTSITSGPFLEDWGTLLTPDAPCEVTVRKKNVTMYAHPLSGEALSKRCMR